MLFNFISITRCDQTSIQARGLAVTLRVVLKRDIGSSVYRSARAVSKPMPGMGLQQSHVRIVRRALLQCSTTVAMRLFIKATSSNHSSRCWLSTGVKGNARNCLIPFSVSKRFNGKPAECQCMQRVLGHYAHLHQLVPVAQLAQHGATFGAEVTRRPLVTQPQ